LKPYTFTISYLDRRLGGLHESTLTLYRWDISSQLWQAIPTTRDGEANTLVASTPLTGTFAVVGMTEVTPPLIYLPFVRAFP
jgi:hypothetical protein